MTFEPYAVVLCFYLLGRRPESAPRLVVGLELGAALVVFGVIFAHLGQEWVGQGGSAWLLFAVIPFAGGRLLQRRSALCDSVAEQTERLRHEHASNAAARAVEERARIARELHDVIAHCVSVMVIQAGGARVVAGRDRTAASMALGVVEECGRAALADLRRIMGVVRRDESEPAVAEGADQLGLLVSRAVDSGVPTRLIVSGRQTLLTADVDLTVYRVVQEALTNVVKHAGDATATVGLTYGAGYVDIQVDDDGTGRGDPAPPSIGSQQGLVGMTERVALCGGSVVTGRRPDGGFRVSARLPLSASTGAAAETERAAERSSSQDQNRRPRRVGVLARRRRWLDIGFAGFWLVVLETEAMVSSHRRGPLALNVVVVGLLALSVGWRRTHPWLLLLTAGASATILHDGLTSSHYATVIGVFTVLIPTYVAAAWLPRRQVTLALALWAAGAITLGRIDGASLGGTVGPLLAAATAIVAGVVFRSQRELRASLDHITRQLDAERLDRERLAVVSERARLARQLHVRVTQGVTTMVVEAAAARRMLAVDAAAVVPTASSDAHVEAIAAIESTGRTVLEQLRRILGALRHSGAPHTLVPQPGLDELYVLLEQARSAGCRVDLTIDGDPRGLAPGLDLATYRVVEDVVASLSLDRVPDLRLALRFADRDVEIEVDVMGGEYRPSESVRARAMLHDGVVRVVAQGAQRSRVVISLSRVQPDVLV
jgi:signal transduction histidine kinase